MINIKKNKIRKKSKPVHFIIVEIMIPKQEFRISFFKIMYVTKATFALELASIAKKHQS